MAPSSSIRTAFVVVEPASTPRKHLPEKSSRVLLDAFAEECLAKKAFRSPSSAKRGGSAPTFS